MNVRLPQAGSSGTEKDYKKAFWGIRQFFETYRHGEKVLALLR